MHGRLKNALFLEELTPFKRNEDMCCGGLGSNLGIQDLFHPLIKGSRNSRLSLFSGIRESLPHSTKRWIQDLVHSTVLFLLPILYKLSLWGIVGVKDSLSILILVQSRWSVRSTWSRASALKHKRRERSDREYGASAPPGECPLSCICNPFSLYRWNHYYFIIFPINYQHLYY